MKIRSIDAGMVRETMEQMIDEFDSLNLESVGEDLRGHGTDPRSPFLAGCVRFCNGPQALDEISGYMNRLHQAIMTEKGVDRDTRERSMRIYNNAVQNLSRAVRRG